MINGIVSCVILGGNRGNRKHFFKAFTMLTIRVATVIEPSTYYASL